jgi:hypothetical protein
MFSSVVCGDFSSDGTNGHGPKFRNLRLLKSSLSTEVITQCFTFIKKNRQRHLGRFGKIGLPAVFPVATAQKTAGNECKHFRES